MKIKMKKKISTLIIKRKALFSMLFIVALFASCGDIDKYELPEAGSIADATPPSANFSYEQGESEDFLIYSFSNLSSSATTYAWNFGDGNTSTDKDAINAFPAIGSYTVMLTASDALGATSTYSETIEVVKPEPPAAIMPVVLEASMEDNSLPDGTGDGRDSWRISGATIFGITSGGSNFHSGNQAAKFEVAPENRLGYQEVAVTPNTDYKLTGYYKFKSSPAGGKVRLAIVGGTHADATSAEAAIFASVEGDDLTDGPENNKYHKLDLLFNSGANSVIGIWIDSNDVTEVRVDDISVVLVQ